MPTVEGRALIGWCALSALVLSVIPGTDAVARRIEGLRLMEERPDGVVTELVLPAGLVEENAVLPVGWNLTQLPGAPELPRTTFLLAVPPGVEPVVSIREIDEAPSLSRIPPPAPRAEIVPPPEGGMTESAPPSQTVRRVRDPAAYARSSPGGWATVLARGRLRHLDVVAIELAPIRWDPQINGLRVARRLVVEVRFPSPAGKAPAQGAELPAPGPPVWDDLAEGLIVNSRYSDLWKRSPGGWDAGATAPKSGDLELRVPVMTTGLYRLSFEMARQAGWDAGIPVTEVALVERTFVEADPDNPFHETDVPILLLDGGDAGVFDPGDEVVFFGQNAWDRFHPAPKDRRYGRENVYWLVRKPSAARMAEESSHLNRDDLEPESSFVDSRRWEGDGLYMKPFAEPDRPFEDGLGLDALGTDHFYWLGGHAGVFTVPFDLPGLLEPVALTVALVGVRVAVGQSASAITLRAGAPGNVQALPGGPVVVPRKRLLARSWSREDLATVPFEEGRNHLEIEAPVTSFGAALDWMECSWIRRVEALEGHLIWNTGDRTGDLEYRISGLGEGELLVFDLSDSAAPKFLPLGPGQVQGDTVEVQVRVAEGSPARVLAAVRLDAMPTPPSLSAGLQEDLRVPVDGEEDWIAIGPEEFLDGLEPLVQARRNEGLVARTVPVRAVFDQFNGGRAAPSAIRNYLRYLFRVRAKDPTFLVLVGDASEDFAGVLPTSGRNWVPTQTVFSSAFPADGPELVASDAWFVERLDGVGEVPDPFPDMLVGRLPVGSRLEVETLVAKILDYEAGSMDEDWRRRALFVADDEYSTGDSFAGDYSWRGDPENEERRLQESTFRWTAREGRRLIRDEAVRIGFGVDSFFVAAYMDTVPCLGRCRNPEEERGGDCSVWTCPNVQGEPVFGYESVLNNHYGTPNTDPDWDNLDFGIVRVAPRLQAQMSRGHLLVTYQGHASARVLTHEYIFQESPAIGRRDSDLLQNDGKPFLFFAWACQLGDFAATLEGGLYGTDCVAERLLLQGGGRGAVGAFTSTAFEWLYATPIVSRAFLETWFFDLDPAGQGSAWRLGELATGTKLQLAAQGQTGPVATLNLLGDPALHVRTPPGEYSIDAMVNGEPWRPGQPLHAGADGETAEIEVALRSRHPITTVRVLEAGAPAPDSLVTIQFDPADPDDPRRVVASYRAPLRLVESPYLVRVEAVDAGGETWGVEFPVEMAASVSLFRPGTGERGLASAGALAPRDSLVLRARTPIPIEPDHVTWDLDSVPLESVRLLQTSDRPPMYVIGARLPDDTPLGDGILRLALSRPGRGEVVRVDTVTVALGNVSFRAWVNGEPWDNGRTLRSAAGSDTSRLKVWVHFAISREQLALFENGAPVRASDYRIRVDDEILPGEQSFFLEYESRLRLVDRPYEIEVRAADAGAPRSLRFPVALGTDYWVRPPGETLRLLSPGDSLRSGDSLLIWIDSPLRIEGQQIDLALDGESLDSVRREGPPDGRPSFQWRAGGLVPARDGPPPSWFDLAVDRGDGERMVRRFRLGGAGGPPGVNVTVNGRTWLEGPITAAAGEDTARVRASFFGPDRIDSLHVYRAGEPVPPWLYQSRLDPDYPRDERRRIVTYNAPITLRERDYHLEIRAWDARRLRSVLLPVRVDARLLLLGPAGDEIDLRAGDLIRPAQVVVARVNAPASLAGGGVQLRLDDRPLDDVIVESIDPDRRSWIATGLAPSGVPGGTRRLRLMVGSEEDLAEFAVPVFLTEVDDAVRILEVYNFPNPFEESTEFHYILSGDAATAHIRLYTLRGRLIWRGDGTSGAGLNLIRWDGRDRDGDRVANGTYFYKLEVRTRDGRGLSRIEKAVRLR